jgi:MYXO-CTERM domain-containing protein
MTRSIPQSLRRLGAGTVLLLAALQAQASLYTLSGSIDRTFSPISSVDHKQYLNKPLSGSFELDSSRVDASLDEQLLALDAFSFSLIGKTFSGGAADGFSAVYNFGVLVGLRGEANGYPKFELSENDPRDGGRRFSLFDDVKYLSGSYRIESGNTPVSEPASLGLGLAALGALAWSRRQRRALPRQG